MDRLRFAFGLALLGFGCGKVEPPACDTPHQFSQSSSVDFAGNTNASVVTTMDQVQLADDLATGDSSDGPLDVEADMMLPGGTYQYTDVTIANGVTLTVTGTQPLVIQASGT